MCDSKTEQYGPQVSQEIDGLRAIAVVPVILFHAGLTSVRGGYVGVDIFFVISGFLITSLIVDALGKGNFSIVQFYERRIRRIMPALLVMMFASAACALILLPPAEIIDFAKLMIAVSFFGSNIYLYTTTNYFSVAADQNPLIHTWSLGVEEQYYLVIPLLLAFMYKYAPKRIVSSILVIAVTSFSLSIIASYRSPTANFFLPITRAWELCAGSILSFYSIRTGEISRRTREIVAALGAAAIFVAIFTFSATTRVPGLPALLPVLGAIAVIAAARSDTVVGRILGSRALVGIGLISYSAYLWHVPLLAFGRIASLTETLTLSMTAVLVAATFLLGYLSWRFVEAPFRGNTIFSRSTVFLMAAAGTVATVGFGMMVVMTNGAAGRRPLASALDASLRLSSRSHSCHDVPNMALRTAGWFCDIPANIGVGRLDFMIVGDSHALALLPVFEQIAAQRGIRGGYSTTGTCPPLVGIDRPDLPPESRVNCGPMMDRVVATVRRQQVRDVFLVARWTTYVEPGYADHPFPLKLIATDKQSLSLAESRQAFPRALQDTINRLRAAGARVHLIAQAPNLKVSPRRLYFKAGGEPSATTLRAAALSRSEHQAVQTRVRDWFVGAAARPGVSIIWPEMALCDAALCPVGRSDRSYYTDDNHLGPEGAKLVRPLIERDWPAPPGAAISAPPSRD